MPNPCHHEADSFLFAMGELRGWPSLVGAIHLAICRRCRVETRKLKDAATQVRGALAPHSGAIAARLWLTRTATVAAVGIGIVGLWVLGREAVYAASAAAGKPRYQQTFQPDSERGTLNRKSAE